ncbi:MAG: hypothetical protein FJ218_09885 [Ignavibacteria bacterium]|nr:hypothetical protein [Ignavibacteria bacterium]
METTTQNKTQHKRTSRSNGHSKVVISMPYADEEVKRLHEESKRIVPKEVIERAIKDLRAMQFDLGYPTDSVEIIRKMRE